MQSATIDTTGYGGVEQLDTVFITPVRTARYITVQSTSANTMPVHGVEVYGVGGDATSPAIPPPTADVVWWDELESAPVNSHPTINLNGPDCEQVIVSSGSGHGCIVFSGPGVYGANTQAVINHGPQTARHGLKCVYSCVDKTANSATNTSRCPTLRPDQNYWNFRAEMRPRRHVALNAAGVTNVEQMPLSGGHKSGNLWYGFSYWLPSTSSLGPLLNGISTFTLAQWESNGGGRPNIYLSVNNPSKIRLITNAGVRDTGYITNGADVGPFQYNQWYDIVMNIRWGSSENYGTDSPHIKVWMYGPGASRGTNPHLTPHGTFTWANIYNGAEAFVPYMKYGAVKGSWENYPTTDASPGAEIMEAWYDSIRIAYTGVAADGFAAVDPATYD